VLASVQTVDVPWLIVGDFRRLGDQIPSASVDLIFTDPPYDKLAAALYEDLAVFAARVLKPGGILMAYSGHMHLPQIYASMGQHLEYMWTCASGHASTGMLFRKWLINVAWKPVLMYGKPPVKVHWATSFADFVTGGKEKADHAWQQSLGEAMHYISAVCPAGGVVLDPFLGSGTTALAAKRLGMQYIGIEVDPATAARARMRVEEIA
jgi:site-specific DNA-methyltransferase (adenine-specific)